MAVEEGNTDQSFVIAIERILGRGLDPRERELAVRLRSEKSAEVVARELDSAIVADPEKIRPEHSDTAKEG